MISYPPLNCITAQNENIFYEQYFHKFPVVIRSFFSNSIAVKNWDNNYFSKECGDRIVKVHEGPTSHPRTRFMLLEEYLNFLKHDDQGIIKNNSDEQQLYLFNLQLMKLGNNIIDDLNVSPGFLLEKWYHKNWKRDLFCFFGNRHSTTRLHYDSLGTHNTFFQIFGKKKFILAEYAEAKNCYLDFPKNTFSPVNPEYPDLDTYPRFKDAKFFQATLEPGDVLYMPPYTLHYVRGLDINISVNIDWHDSKSVVNAFTKKRVRGFICHYWNFISFLGVKCSIPNDWLYPLYKSQYR